MDDREPQSLAEFFEQMGDELVSSPGFETFVKEGKVFVDQGVLMALIMEMAILGKPLVDAGALSEEKHDVIMLFANLMASVHDAALVRHTAIPDSIEGLDE